MADITDPEVIRYTNETTRPMMEKLVALAAQIDAALLVNDVQIQPLLVASGNVPSDPIMDGREAQGVSRLTMQDHMNAVKLLQALQSRFDQAGVRAAMVKPTVRSMSAILNG